MLCCCKRRVASVTISCDLAMVFHETFYMAISLRLIETPVIALNLDVSVDVKSDRIEFLTGFL